MPGWLEFLFLLFWGGPPVNCRPDLDAAGNVTAQVCQVGQTAAETPRLMLRRR